MTKTFVDRACEGLITVSIVSHGHGHLLRALLDDLAACPEVSSVILTHNIPEANVNYAKPGWLHVVNNPKPKGFGSNHNAAFQCVHTPYFAVLNPDVRLTGNPFPALVNCFKTNDASLCAPAVIDPTGALEDSTRQFPTITNLVMKALGLQDGRLQYTLRDPPLPVPWVAGMFVLMRSTDYSAMNGFDEGYFLYYEDVDLCARLKLAGGKIILCPGVQVVHDARRASRRNLRHMWWHAASMVRYFRKYLWRSFQQTTG